MLKPTNQVIEAVFLEGTTIPAEPACTPEQHPHASTATSISPQQQRLTCRQQELTLPASMGHSSLLVAADIALGAGSLSGMCTAGHFQGKEAAEARQSNQTRVIPQHHPQDAIEFIGKEFQS